MKTKNIKELANISPKQNRNMWRRVASESYMCLQGLANIYVSRNLQSQVQPKPLWDKLKSQSVHFANCRQFGALRFSFSLLTFAYSFPPSHHFHLHSHPHGCTPRGCKYSDCCHTGNGVVIRREHSLKQKMGKQKQRLRVESKC